MAEYNNRLQMTISECLARLAYGTAVYDSGLEGQACSLTYELAAT